MPELQISKLNKQYNKDAFAVQNFNLNVEVGEFIVFLGPSGCGKSTVLRMIAGLEDITSGEIKIDNKIANNLPPKDRKIGMVFQDYALFPHMTVAQNIGYGLRIQGKKKSEISERVLIAASRVNLEPYLTRYPSELSGGQRQRVALARAIIRNVELLLMDEPLSNLDAKMRVKMRKEIMEIHRQFKMTTIYVTHDQIEAMTMADRIVVLKNGEIQQVGTPTEIYDHPNNQFVASFIGSPPMNIIQINNADARKLSSDTAWTDMLSDTAQGISIGFRPEAVHIRPPQSPHLEIMISFQSQELIGHEVIVTACAYDQEFAFRLVNGFSNNLQNIDRVFVDYCDIHLFGAENNH